MYDNLLPSREPNIFKSDVLVVFPNRDQLGRRVLVLELGSKYFPNNIKQINYVVNN